MIGGIGLGVVLIILSVSFLIGKFNARVKTAYLSIKKKVIWNSIIRYFLQSTLKLQIAAAADIYFTQHEISDE